MCNYADSVSEMRAETVFAPPPGPNHLRDRTAPMARTVYNIVSVTEKACTRCSEVKAASEFFRAPRCKSGLTSWCRVCMRWNQKRYYDRDKAAGVQRSITWAKNNPEKTKANQHRRRVKAYGLTPEQFAAMTAEQNGACAICGTVGHLVIDHCHGSGIVRGLLCQKCNKGIGLLADSPEVLKVAASYLERAR